MATDAQLLDLVFGQRQATFRFELLDNTNAVVGELHPDVDSPPIVECNINRTIKRTMDGLRLLPADAAAVDTIQQRVRPVMVLANGSEYPLGVFLFGDDSRQVHTWGNPMAASMVDQVLILDQALERSVGYPAGASIADALAEQFAAAGIVGALVDPVATVFGAPAVWPAGTSRYAAMTDMAGMAGCFAPFFDNLGVGRVIRATDLATAPVDVAYAAGASSRILVDTILESNSLLAAPNRYIALDTSLQDAPVVGFFDVPDTVPYSAAARGFVVARVLEVQGLQDQAAADAYAATAAAEDSGVYRWLTFSGAPDPRHDTYQVVDFLGVHYREQAWRMTLLEGAPMEHELRGVF